MVATPSPELRTLARIAHRAGAIVMRHYEEGAPARKKSDQSPVTDADEEAEAFILAELEKDFTGIAVVAEEEVAAGRLPKIGRRFFLVDPLDGTKEFVAGRNEFTVNIALVTRGTPLLGIVGAPALGLIWRGIVGRGAERLTFRENAAPLREPIHTRACPLPKHSWMVAVSRSHGDPGTEAFIAARPGAVRIQLGSAVKFGRLAEGAVDIYPRLSPTCEWDVAAGHAVVTAAGGKVTDPSGAALRFGLAKDFLVPEFIAWGDPAAAEPSLRAQRGNP